MKLSEKQVEFLSSIYDPLDMLEEQDFWWGCFKRELRTVNSLCLKGLVEFREGKKPSTSHDYFDVRLTKKGREVLSKRST